MFPIPFEYLIVCPFALVAGFVDAIAGGGGLISLPAFFFAGIPVHSAIASNKFSSFLGTLIATIRYALFGYMVKRFVVVGVVFGLTGSAAGAWLMLQVDVSVFLVFMIATLPFIAFFVLKTKNLDRFSNIPLAPTKQLVLTGAIAFVLGAYDGFYGPGTGTFLMLLLTSLAHFNVRQAAGTTKAINLSTNAAALAVFFAHGEVLVALGLTAGVFNIIGNWLGSTLFGHKGATILRPIMLGVIVLFAARLVWDLVA